MRKRRVRLQRSRLLLVLVVALVGFTFPVSPFSTHVASAAEASQYFPQTGHTVSGKFLAYWQANGGLPTFGYPITEAQNETDPETGHIFLTQWFERNRFELHPENAGTKYEVELGLLGKDLRREALAVDPTFGRVPPLFDPTRPRDQQMYFSETGHNLDFGFLQYWQNNGGLERFGYPISEPHNEIQLGSGGGVAFYVQWFERARLELHPDNIPPYNFLLGLLGRELKTAPGHGYNSLWEIGPDLNGVPQPNKLAVDSQGNSYVLSSNARFEKFDQNGQRVAAWSNQVAFSYGHFISPYALAVDSQDNVYVADLNGAVVKFDSNGHFLSKFGGIGISSSGPQNVFDLAVDKIGNIYVLVAGTAEVEKFDPNGQLLFKWSSFVNGARQLIGIGGIAIDSGNNVYLSDSQNGRVQKFDSTGNYLATIGSAGNGDGQFVLPSGLAVDKQNNLYVTEARNFFETGHKERVQKFDQNGHFLRKWGGPGAGPGQFETPSGVAIDNQGVVYIADSGNNRVQKFAGDDAHFLSAFATYGAAVGQLVKPGKLAADSQGNFYVADSGNNRVQKFDANGRFLFTFGSYGTGDGQLYHPYAVAVDNQGSIYVTDNGNNRIQKFDAQGNFLLKFGSAGSGDGQFQSMDGLAVEIAPGSAGNVFLVDSKLNRVLKFDNKGHFLTKWGTYNGSDGKQLIAPKGITTDLQGNVYVTSTLNNQILKFDANGKLLLVWGSYGPNSGQFAAPEGVAVDSGGNVYVADTVNDRIQEFDANGNFLNQWNGIYFRPLNLVILGQGNIYISDLFSRVLKLHLYP